MRARLRPLSSVLLPWILACAGEGSGASVGGATDTSVGSTSGDAAGSDASPGASSGSDDSAPGSSSGAADASAGTDGGATDTGGDATGDATGDTQGDVDDCPRVRVTVDGGQSLNIRPDPSTQNPPIGALPKGAIVDVLAEVVGEAIEGIDLWFEISSSEGDGYVWSGLVECTFDEAPELEPPGSFWLPLECGSSALVTQGNNGGFSHYGTSAYGFDFGLTLGTPLVAIADGVVQTALFQTMPGDPCYNGGGQECGGKENLVTLLHGDGTTSTYVHLSDVSVGEGEFVPRGAVVGLVGSTGWSTGRHAHVQRQENCGWGFCQSIPVAFVDVPGDGVPVTGQTVTSMNCP